MNDPHGATPSPATPTIQQRTMRPSLVWLVPAVAALIGVSMLVHAWMSAGPEITITFRTAAGLEAGKTPVKYKDVTVGTVTAIRLSDDDSHVVATVALDKSAERLTRQDTRFWVVRPRIGTGGISGIDTLLSGAYISADAGSKQESATDFAGLETPPTIVGGAAGKSFTLLVDDLGSLDVGSPIYYRRIPVGRVASYQLDPAGKHVRLLVFVDAPYDAFVTTDTRFWNASGVDLSISADGLKLKTQSVATIVAGGLAFATPAYRDAPAAAENTEFTVSKDQAEAMAPPDGPAQFIQLRFRQPLRGLSTGAPVQFAGVDLGRVVSISVDYDADAHRFPTIVGVLIYPQRLGRVLDKLPKRETDSPDETSARLLQGMVDNGLRAQARSGNLLTGQLYIALDFVPNAPKVAFDASARPISIPTIDGSFDKMQEQLANIITKVEKMPLDSIGRNLDASLSGLNQTLTQVNTQMLPETTRTLQRLQQMAQEFQQTAQSVQGLTQSAQGLTAEDGPLQQNLEQTLLETQRAARSLRTLTDLLGRNPDSLLRGRPSDPPPAPGASSPSNLRESSQ
ncbi:MULTISPECIES: PqiB family protein [unclassified Acidovorax]|jgi:paraquat-inducible protein B|uniref:PqiB family protein n=1 Tax=unclassified Acidovorax TaxID=2684926 RepID=UPI000B3F6E46|nr:MULTISPECIES: MlaD family protein [unclassified Acidovorax]